MARTKNNATNGLSGRIGQLVFRTIKRTNKTFASKVPYMGKVVPSKSQENNREFFKHAARYAKAILRQPGMKEYFLRKDKHAVNAYLVAWKEFYRALQNGASVMALYDALLQSKNETIAPTQYCAQCTMCAIKSSARPR
jgi:hypothetical protein